jgi:Asp-tRNAAsn/Glu-tRNAGln amidotransferase B subunit (PET112 homolog)
MWDDYSKTTIEIRRKESEEDYRYFPEPDLPFLRLKDFEFKFSTPFEKFNYYLSMGISEDYAEVIVRDINLNNYFELFLSNGGDPIIGSNLIVNIIKSFENFPNANELSKLTILMKENKIPNHIARQKLLEMKDKLNVDEIIKNFEVLDENEIKNIVIALIEKYPQKFLEYKSGKLGLLGFFIGEAKKINSKVDPKVFKEVFEKISQTL